MFCRQCELPLATGQGVCPRCGTPVHQPGVLDWIIEKLKGLLLPLASVHISKGGTFRIVSPVGKTKVYTSLNNLPPEIREEVAARIPESFATSDVQTFNSLDEAPPEIRAKFEQALHGDGSRVELVDHNTGQKQVYNSLDEMPPDIRDYIEQIEEDTGIVPKTDGDGKIRTEFESANISFFIQHDR